MTRNMQQNVESKCKNNGSAILGGAGLDIILSATTSTVPAVALGGTALCTISSYRVEISRWEENAASLLPGFIMAFYSHRVAGISDDRASKILGRRSLQVIASRDLGIVERRVCIEHGQSG